MPPGTCLPHGAPGRRRRRGHRRRAFVRRAAHVADPREHAAAGEARVGVLGANYNWGNSADSWLGRWWTIYIGLGLAMGNTSVSLDGEDYNWQASGLTFNFGFDYRFENNVTVGLHAHSTNGKVKYNGAQMTANYSSGNFVIGYLY